MRLVEVRFHKEINNLRPLERVKGIEPSYEAWEAAVLPLNYTRSAAQILPSCATGHALRGRCRPARPAGGGDGGRRFLRPRRRPQVHGITLNSTRRSSASVRLSRPLPTRLSRDPTPLAGRRGSGGSGGSGGRGRSSAARRYAAGGSGAAGPRRSGPRGECLHALRWMSPRQRYLIST